MVSGSSCFPVALGVLDEAVRESLNSFAPSFVDYKRESLPEGGVKYGLTHPHHGNLRQVTLHKRGDKQTEMCVEEPLRSSMGEQTAVEKPRVYFKDSQGKRGRVVAGPFLGPVDAERARISHQKSVIECLFDRLRCEGWTRDATSEPTLVTPLPPGSVRFDAIMDCTPAQFASLLAELEREDPAYVPMLDRLHLWPSSPLSPALKQVYGRLGLPHGYRYYRYKEFAWVTVCAVPEGGSKLKVAATESTWRTVEPYWAGLREELEQRGWVARQPMRRRAGGAAKQGASRLEERQDWYAKVEKVKSIDTMVRDKGVPIATACQLNGVPESTYRRYRKRLDELSKHQ